MALKKTPLPAKKVAAAVRKSGNPGKGTAKGAAVIAVKGGKGGAAKKAVAKRAAYKRGK